MSLITSNVPDIDTKSTNVLNELKHGVDIAVLMETKKVKEVKIYKLRQISRLRKC